MRLIVSTFSHRLTGSMDEDDDEPSRRPVTRDAIAGCWNPPNTTMPTTEKNHSIHSSATSPSQCKSSLYLSLSGNRSRLLLAAHSTRRQRMSERKRKTRETVHLYSRARGCTCLFVRGLAYSHLMSGVRTAALRYADRDSERVHQLTMASWWEWESDCCFTMCSLERIEGWYQKRRKNESKSGRHVILRWPAVQCSCEAGWMMIMRGIMHVLECLIDR